MAENQFAQLEVLLASLKDDAEKFYVKGNKTAGTRLRKGMQEVKNLATGVRKEVSDLKNA